MNDQYRLF
jgi:hypothetical protein